jgi:CRP/FNR family transcriptional regulator
MKQTEGSKHVPGAQSPAASALKQTRSPVAAQTGGVEVIPIADDGDECSFCSTCAFSSACLAEGYGKGELQALHCLVEHEGPFAAGTHLFREGDPFTSIAAVRAGTVKTYVVDDRGREQVHGFFLPGEVIGLSAIHGERYPCNAQALDTVTVCRFSFPLLATLAGRMPGLQRRLFDLLSQDIGKASLLAGDFSADQRLAAFLISLSRRLAARGFSPTRFLLTMSRSDIASYLRLAPETVSRVFRRFADEGLMLVERKSLHLLQPDVLLGLARDVLRERAG